MLEMVKEAGRELLEYPKRGSVYYIKRAIKKLAGRAVEPPDRINWPNGILAKGLMDHYMRHQNSGEATEALDALKAYYDRWIKKGCPMYYLDDAFSGMALIGLHQVTGDERYRQGAEVMAQYLFHQKTDSAGSLCYRPGQENQYIFADAIGLACPFLCQYGTVYEKPDAINLAAVQIQNFMDFGMDQKTGLPYHGYQYESGVKHGVIGWGRAVGWLMVGMAESLAYMDPERPDYDVLKQSYRRLVDKVESYQLENGLYAWQLEAREGPADTSATAMILYAVARSLETKVLIGIHRSRMMRGRQALWGMVREGKLGQCLAECRGFSEYPQVYGEYPWSLGMALSLFVMTDEGDERC